VADSTQNSELASVSNDGSQKRFQSEKKKEAKIMGRFSLGACRTKVLLYRLLKPLWQKRFNENKFFKFRVINRRYNRKLSDETAVESNEPKRKISWDE
jgi:hypothetical protein